MKRFNLSGWAVSHPTLILFLMIALGAGLWIGALTVKFRDFRFIRINTV